MSRRGGSTRGDFEEEEHFSRKGPGRPREEFDLYKRRGPPAEFASPPPRERERDRQVPEFLREDYSRREVDNGPLVLRQKEVETFTRGERERPRPRSPSPERERIVRKRVVERARSLSPEPVERVRTRIVQRERSDSPSPVERERIFRRKIVERESSPSPPPERERVIRTRVVERERERSPSPPPPERMVRTRIIERSKERERSPSPPPKERVKTRTIEIQRNRSPSPPPERTTTRIIEREDFRRRPRSPTPERERSRVVVRERIRQPSPPSPSPSPSPPPPIIREPPIHQDIITHHHHYNIDHGVLYEPARVPSPPPPPKAKSRNTEIDIYTSKNETEIDIYKGKAQSSKGSPSSKAGTSRDEDDIFFERDRLSVKDKRARHRSLSVRREEKWEDEADYYNRRADERGYMGEAWNGATKDWAIVDVPPGTERVVMDGIGGGGQEITWQRYNGVRRSKFLPSREKEKEKEKERERDTIVFKEEKVKEIEPPGKEMAIYEREYEREEISDNRALGKWHPPSRPREKEQSMWTEITKDLVVREAIEEMGYDFEETEFFFYVIQYLRYEDVLELVKLSEEIRAERKERIREMQWEREREAERKERERKERKREEKLLKEMGAYEDERIYEREVIYDGPPRRSSRYLR